MSTPTEIAVDAGETCGAIAFRGPDAAKFLQGQLSADVGRLAPGATTLAALIAEQELADAKVATAVNGEFVPARARAQTPLAAGDRVEILSARQGG